MSDLNASHCLKTPVSLSDRLTKPFIGNSQKSVLITRLHTVCKQSTFTIRTVSMYVLLPKG